MLCIPRYASSLFHPYSSTISSLSLVYNVLIIFRGDTFSGLTDPKIQILSTPSQSDGWPTNLLSLLRRDGRHLRHGVQRHGSRLRNCEVRDWWVEMWKELTDSVHVMSICYVMVQIPNLVMQITWHVKHDWAFLTELMFRYVGKGFESCSFISITQEF